MHRDDQLDQGGRRRDGSIPPRQEGKEELISVHGIGKSFGSLQALKDVDFSLNAGEVHCLLGENGAGKSTLMRIIFGLYQPDAGQIFIRGKQTIITSPRTAIDLQIGMVHQQFMLVPTMSVSENIFLGEIGPLEVSNRGGRLSRLHELVDEYSFDIDLDTQVGSLSLGQRQRVEILKLLFRNSKVLILDEPTSVLTPQEVDKLFETLSRLVKSGMGIVFITHKLHEVLLFGDYVTVLREGRVTKTSDTSSINKGQLTTWMFGESNEEHQMASRADPPVNVDEAESGLILESVSVDGDNRNSAIDSVNLTVRSGEIIGVAGVSGNGQRELAEALAGVRPVKAGSIRLRGKNLAGFDPRSVREMGLAYIPEERSAGLAADLSVDENLMIADYHDTKFNRFGFLRVRALKEFSHRLGDQFSVPMERHDQSVQVLSGGNQQRVIVARALAHQPVCVVATQATIGLDMATCTYVHQVLREVTASGGSVVYISTDLDELLGLADRIAVLFEGRIVRIVEQESFDKREIGYLMAGGGVDKPN